tara:strand:- start:106391 stop:107356 length:966 start_codon:yes stop_codon:yes gene_type:complete
MNILVTGGAGYIGSHVVHELIDKGNRVTIFDDLSTGNENNIDTRAKFFRGSTLIKSDLEKVMKNRFDGVIHLAASKAAGESMLYPEKYIINNLMGSYNLLLACCKNNINNFVFSSSAAVYGLPQYIPLDENHPTIPINYYGETKLQIETNLIWFNRLKNINYASLRYFNAAGYDINGRIKGKENNPQNLIPAIMEAATGIRKKLFVFGNDYKTKDGTGVRDYIHVNDLATAHLKALNYLIKSNNNLIINLATGIGHSVLDVIKETEKISKNKIKYIITDRREGDADIIISKSIRSQKELKWKPRYSDLETLIKTTWNIYKK